MSYTKRYYEDVLEPKESILKLHGIFYKYEGFQLYAGESYTTKDHKAGFEWIDVTNWSLKQLFDWLGY